MKLKIFASESRGFRVVRAVAVINKSKAFGIISRRQKTFTVRTVAPNFAISELERAFKSEASRWENKILARISEKKDKTSQTTP